MKLCAVVPVYNHADAIADVVRGIRAHGLPVCLVDDGSEPRCAAVLRELAAADAQVMLHVRPGNGGKGSAVMDGVRAVHAAGYTHALQIDADGQHDTADIPRFVAAAQRAPQAVINGCPVYDESVPRARLYGRYLTHVWVWINTLSLRIEDSMCGFRIYPLASMLPLLDRVRMGRRMDFDTEILVRMDWESVPIQNLRTRVRYPQDGVSHFRPFTDNAFISGMHTRLFFGMLLRAPRLLLRHILPARRAT